MVTDFLNKGPTELGRPGGHASAGFFWGGGDFNSLEFPFPGF